MREGSLRREREGSELHMTGKSYMYEKRECSRAKQQSQIDHIGNCKILEYPFVLSHSHIAAATWQQYIHTNVRKSTPRTCVNVKVMIKPTTNQPANDRFVVQRQRRCGSIAIATIIHLYIGIIDSVISYSFLFYVVVGMSMFHLLQSNKMERRFICRWYNDEFCVWASKVYMRLTLQLDNSY